MSVSASSYTSSIVSVKVGELIADNKVMIFSKSYCPYCTKVKSLFQSLNIPYHSLELDLLPDGKLIQDLLFEISSQKTVPNVFINGTHVGGHATCLKMHEDGTLIGLYSEKYSEYQYDLIVIGGGSGGLAASKEAAQLGKTVLVCDYVVPSPYGTKWGLGGTCVNVGCIPKKLMHKAALIGSDFEDAPFFGWEMPEKVNHNWMKMVEEIQNYIKSLNWGYRKSLKEKSVTYMNAHAQFVDSHTLSVNEKGSLKEVTAKDFLIAVGGRPKYPNIPGAKEFGITSDDIFSLSHSPGKTLIVGASYIALECAGFLIGLGLDCTVMVRSIFLRGFDQQIAEMIGNNMSKHGVKFQKGCIPTSIEKIKDGEPGLYKVTGQKSDGEVVEGEYNTVIFAIGRDPCTKSLNIEAAGVALNMENNKIIVNDMEQTSVPNIYAIGDVADGKPELTPVAIQAGKLLSQRLYGQNNTLTDYDKVPTTVFTPMEYGCVGLSEEAALDKYGKDDVEVYHTHFQPLEYALSQRDMNQSYGKLICIKSENERVIGFHVLGPNAGEITQGYALSIKLGAKKSDFANLVGIHPTCAEVFTTMSITKASGASVVKSEC